MMRRVLLSILLVTALAAPPARAAGLLDAPLSYTATRTVTVGQRSYTGPVFHIPGRERHEQTLLGMQQVFILDENQGTGFLVLPTIKTMITFPFPPLMAALLDPVLAKSALGEDKVDDIAVTKYRVEKTAPDGTRGEGFLWISHRGVLMKLAGAITAPGGHRTLVQMALSGLKEAAQSPALFVPPSGLTKLPVEALAPLLGVDLR